MFLYIIAVTERDEYQELVDYSMGTVMDMAWSKAVP